MNTDTYAYWTERLRSGDIRAVGRLGLSARLNRTLYRLHMENVSRLVRQHPILPAENALEVGAGWGDWIDFWHANGVSTVDATDFAEPAVDWLRGHYPSCRISLLDVTETRAFDGWEQYPLVSCMNVLLHIFDDDAFRRALDNLASVVAPGGYLLIADPVLLGGRVRRDPPKTCVDRPLAAYRRPLEAAGLTLADIAPAAAIAGDPIEAPSRAAWRLVQAWWKTVVMLDHLPPLRSVLGILVRTADRAAARAGRTYTGRLLLFRRS